MDEYIRFLCPNPACKKRLKAPREQVGRRARCSCGQSVVVPSTEPLQLRDGLPVPARQYKRMNPTPALLTPPDGSAHRPRRWPWFVGGGIGVLLMVGIGAAVLTRETSKVGADGRQPTEKQEVQQQATPKKQRPPRPLAKLDPSAEKQLAGLVAALRTDEWDKVVPNLDQLTAGNGKKDMVGHVLHSLSVPIQQGGESKVVPFRVASRALADMDLEAILSEFDNPDWSFRANAVAALSQRYKPLGPILAEFVNSRNGKQLAGERLLTLADDEEQIVRANAVYALVHCTPEEDQANPCLLVALKDQDSVVRANAAGAFYRSKKSDEIVSALATTLKDADLDVARNAALSLRAMLAEEPTTPRQQTILEEAKRILSPFGEEYTLRQRVDLVAKNRDSGSNELRMAVLIKMFVGEREK